MRLSERLHNALFALFLLAMAGYGVAFAAHMLTQFDIINLVRDVNVDDSFYYFEIASNMAEGQFSTFDGGITRTNGYHPLWLWLITPFYWLLDKEAALFAIKALEILLIAGAAMLVTVAARLARLPWILLVALLPALYQIRALYLGMEAAIGLFMLALFTLALVLYGATRHGGTGYWRRWPSRCPGRGWSMWRSRWRGRARCCCWSGHGGSGGAEKLDLPSSIYAHLFHYAAPSPVS